MIPRATYRLQFHKGFTFADAATRADYFAALGISHVYASPILVARAGSPHGYDVVDHSRVNPELGGEEGFRALVAALKTRGIGIVLDIVPNHVAVGDADNPWWLDLLANGRAGTYARYFDIDWDAPGLEGRVLAPFLDGAPEALLDRGDLTLMRDDALGWCFAYFSHRFPLRPEDQADPRNVAPAALLARQHFVLADWRQADARVNWRRFFDINELAAIRVGEPEVFEVVHRKVFALYAEGLIDGVRVDHVDGIADPAAYCHRLRRRLGALGREPWLIVEKILAEDEALPASWQADGTTGYDFMDEVSALQHCAAGDTALDRLWQVYGRQDRDFETEEAEARRETLATRFPSQLAATARAFCRPLGMPCDLVEPAIAEAIVWLRCYRSYATGAPGTPGSGRHLSAALARAARHAPGLAAPLAALFARSDGDASVMDALRRFHQLSAPVAAKAVEDTALYRYGRLLSRNDVGFDPRTTQLSVAAFHARMQLRAAQAPRTMLATATHDHKRGEDTRARLAVLSAQSARWETFAREAMTERPAALAPADVYQLLQTLLGVWPDAAAPGDEDLARRLEGWCRKYLREAKQRSNWDAPDTAYEDAFCVFARHLVLAPEARGFRGRLAGLLRQIAPEADANMLVQAALRCTLPGVADLYQGCEFEDFSLVDPDNRRPVDFAVRLAALEKGTNEKQTLIARLLAARAANPDLWRLGDYRPLPVKADNVIAFQRRHGRAELTVVARLGGAAQEGWLELERPYADLVTGTPVQAGRLALAELLCSCPVRVLHPI